MADQSEAEQTVDELVKEYRQEIEEIFAKDTFKLTFDEREKLIDHKIDKGRCRILEKHIEEDPEGISRNKPDEVSRCICGSCATLCRDENGDIKIFEREIKTKRGPIKVKEQGYYCSKCRKLFFPQRKKLNLFKENYSPDMLRKITYAGAHSTSSYQEAQNNLKNLAEFFISTSHIQRLTTKIAKEFDQKDYSSSNLLEDLPEPDNQDKIEVASISVDGGRTQIREENSGPGVHNPRWIEPKAGCLQILESKEQDSDPHPLLPKIFQDKKAVKHMVERLKGKRESQDNVENDKITKIDSHLNEDKQSKKDNSYRPKVLKRFVIADIDKVESFGHLLYRKMYQHNLHSASRKAYLGDGDRKLWSIYEENFRADDWTPVLDFIHAVEYAYEASKLSTQTEQQCWAKYIDYVTHIWQGKPLTVIRRLDKIVAELENAKKAKSKSLNDKIDKLKSIRGYFQNNFNKMNYSEYRKRGLPISSCHVESLIKQFNIRIKSSEKFWNQSSVKGIVKIKASLLSDDNSWAEFWNNRFDHQIKSKMIYNQTELKLAA